MSNQENTNYNAITNDRNPFINLANNNLENDTDGENEDTPLDSGIMIHVVPDANKCKFLIIFFNTIIIILLKCIFDILCLFSARWNHIVDLDSFFTRMYYYHQKHGFNVMMVQEGLELIQFVFVVLFTTYMCSCVKYDKLFNKEGNYTIKYSIGDVVIPIGECAADLSGTAWAALALSGIFLIFRTIKVCYHVFQFYDIKMFFNLALKIEDVSIQTY